MHDENTNRQREGQFEDSNIGYWVVHDGIEQADGMKASLNGTWLYLGAETEIYDQMTFKVSEILFEAKLS